MNSNNFQIDQFNDTYKDIDFCMGYGSGFKEQEGYEDKVPMKDFVLGVENIKEWHEKNYQLNKDDYSRFVKIFGKKFLDFLQNKGAKIYYHPFIKHQGGEIKYGVISIDDLIDDLENWKNLYIAGRLHKPVELFSTTGELEEHINKNYEYALNTAILLLPTTFTEKELYEKITSLSYSGDTRMKIGENPNKIKNIVSKNIEGFRNIYMKLLKNDPNILTLNGKTFYQESSIDNKLERSMKLPSNLGEHINKQGDIIQEVNNRLHSIIKQSSTEQTLIGIGTAGVRKSIRYAYEKIGKNIKGRLKKSSTIK